VTRAEQRCRDSRDESGSAATWVVALVGALVLLGLGASFVTAVAAAHRHAQSAADLAALAAAQAHQQGEDGCGRAAVLAARNEATLVACALLGEDVSVRVRVDGPELAGLAPTVTGSARAGPAP
jgi:secretion/DNA translocation related TadE-like protein